MSGGDSKINRLKHGSYLLLCLTGAENFRTILRIKETRND